MKVVSASVCCLAVALFSALQPATAVSTEMRYEYDARGRLVQVSRGGSGAYEARYTYDKADNRLVKTVSGGAAPPPVPAPTGAAVVVVPRAGGYSVIPIRRE